MLLFISLDLKVFGSELETARQVREGSQLKNKEVDTPLSKSTFYPHDKSFLLLFSGRKTLLFSASFFFRVGRETP
jgi:hypothetical protein